MAVALARKIVKRELSDGFALRDVYRRGWTDLSDRDDVKRAVELLCDLDWLSSVREETDGAPRTRFWINPKIYGSPVAPSDKTDKSNEKTLLSALSVPPPASSPKSTAALPPDDSDQRERTAIQEVEREAEENDREA